MNAESIWPAIDRGYQYQTIRVIDTITRRCPPTTSPSTSIVGRRRRRGCNVRWAWSAVCVGTEAAAAVGREETPPTVQNRRRKWKPGRKSTLRMRKTKKRKPTDARNGPRRQSSCSRASATASDLETFGGFRISATRTEAVSDKLRHLHDNYYLGKMMTFHDNLPVHRPRTNKVNLDSGLFWTVLKISQSPYHNAKFIIKITHGCLFASDSVITIDNIYNNIMCAK